jgi:transketolase
MDITQLKTIAAQVRRDIVRMTHNAKSGHPGGSLGCTEFMTALYFDVLRLKEESGTPVFDMDGIGEDIFFLSNGHISPVWYSILARRGYFKTGELGTFRKIDSRLQGHPATAEHLPGVRVASGSLGQGMSVAIGAAIAKKHNDDPHLVYSLHGDGEINEGQIWEAMHFAVHHKVDNLIATIDRNGQQIDGPTEKVMALGDVAAKFRAFGWDVLEMNGNVMEEVLETLALAKSRTGKGKPIALIMTTVMGFGVDFMENDHNWHGVAPNDEQLERALSQLPETIGDY